LISIDSRSSQIWRTKWAVMNLDVNLNVNVARIECDVFAVESFEQGRETRGGVARSSIEQDRSDRAHGCSGWYLAGFRHWF
jgi:hypothetical protein